MQGGFNYLMQRRTTFVIAHRLSTVTGADKIVVLDNGRIMETGTHEELLKREGRYHSLYTSQNPEYALDRPSPMAADKEPSSGVAAPAAEQEEQTRS